MEEEIWLPIPRLEESHEASNFGRVRSKTRTTTGRRKGIIKAKMIKLKETNESIFLHVKKDNMWYFMPVREVVAQLFVPNPNNYDQIKHKDGNTKNNHHSNLEWYHQTAEITPEKSKKERNKMYWRAISYAFKCNPLVYRDIVHQAFIKNFDKDGSNLFDKGEYYVLACIKFEWFAYFNKGMFTRNGEKYIRYFVEVEDYHLSNKSNSPLEVLETKEFYENLYTKINNYHSNGIWSIAPELLREITTMFDEGYTSFEISQKIGVSPQSVSYYKKKIQSLIKEMDEVG